MKELSTEELIYFSRQFANMFGLAVRIFKGDKQIFRQFHGDPAADPLDICKYEIMLDNDEVSYYVYDNCLYFGIVNRGEYKFIIGPVSELRSHDDAFRKIGITIGVKKELLQGFVNDMKALSGIHLDTLLQMLVLFNFTVNRTMYSISDIRIKQPEQQSLNAEMRENDISFAMSTGFYNSGKRTAAIESDIIKKVMNGDTQGLIEGASKVPSVSSGYYAPGLIRHQKNFFIRLETIVSRTAIHAGLDPDEILAAEEKYIMKCESLNHIDRIKNLQYYMILDYAERVRKFKKHNVNDSKMVSDTANYIKSHISEPLKTSDIAEHFGRNRASFATDFKKKSGVNLSEFIKLIKIQEAEELLQSTEKSLSEIAYLFGFSSQSHFCSVFKSIRGMTPTEFRRRINIGTDYSLQ